ncbi:hypothetical protein CB0940_02394 [Cercospora beticola]|uniref:Transmembrane protein 53 n=1 Tax=Cercospora beticola TaxID=122368 RepID=A0A2G5I4Z2_CERBT|nr:hypothetical protein CB0940_02394 [Cercospora beticola]PIA99821.1 hypothetical protein CB0940_02394 [Cercospora beticola]WPA99530.1 hypothetical protein RHO25_004148 [Cercospora beticola]
MAAGKAPDGFEVLTETISIQRPETNASSDETPPPLFVICSWMAAFPRHIQKYTDQYKKLYPSSTILLIQSTWKDVSGTDKFMKPRLAIAVSIIQDHLLQTSSKSTSTTSRPPPSPKIFLHIFSNGGATIANHLSIQLNSSLSSSPSLSPSTHNSSHQPGSIFSRLILECTPSRPNTSQAVLAVASAALPASKPFLLRLLGKFLIRCFVSYGFWKCWVLGKENMVDKLRRRLNSPFLTNNTKSESTNPSDAVSMKNEEIERNENGLTVPKEEIWDASIPRLYMYSKSDEVVSWQDVRDHAKEARDVKGFENVREEVFEKAPHVGLPREDFERYWGVVEGWWKGEEVDGGGGAVL